MNDVLRSLVRRNGGLVNRNETVRHVSADALDRACRAGHLWRIFPGVYVDAQLIAPIGLGSRGIASLGVERSSTTRADGSPALEQARGRARWLWLRAAVAYANGRGALSHTTALSVWGLHRQSCGQPPHLSVPSGASLRSQNHLVVHQRLRFTVEPPQVVIRRGLPVTSLEQSLIDSWPLLPAEEQPAALIRAVNDRMTTPERVSRALAGAPKLGKRVQLRVLLDRLHAGCRSPLEIWGHDRVFTGPEMPPLQRQRRIRIGGRSIDLDVYAETEQVNFELDGATAHGARHQREIDVKRDALLATVGILVVRFTHRRLVTQPDEVRREVLAILAKRGG